MTHILDPMVVPSDARGAGTEHVPLDGRLLAERDYWRDKLTSRSDYARLTRGGLHAAAGGGLPVSVTCELDARLVERLDRLTSREPFLVYTALVAAIHVCLHRYTGSTAVLTASPTLLETGAPRRPNFVAVAQDVDPSMPFREFLQRVRLALSDAYARPHYPFRSLLTDLSLDPDAPVNGLLDVAVALRGFHHDAPLIGCAMSVVFGRDGRAIRATATCDPTAFRPADAAAFLDHVMSLLEDGLTRPNAALASLAMAPPEHIDRIAREWSVGPREDVAGTVVEQVAAQATRTPDAVAVVAGDSAITYAALEARATALAHELRDFGVRSEVRVGVCVERSVELMVALLGVWKACGAYVPLDPAAPRARLAAIVDGARLAVIVTHGQADDRLPAVWVPVVRLDPGTFDEGRPAGDLPAPAAATLAYVLYTSGSTGTPKGVEVTHAGVRNLVAAQIAGFALEPGARVLQYASVGFDASVSEIFTALGSGATLELLIEEEARAGEGLARRLRERAITAVTLPPSVWRGLQPAGLPALVTAISAGEACSAEIAEAWQGRRFLNAYGPTEATVCATMATTVDTGSAPPIGRPIANAQAYVLDSEQRLVPAGVAGELYVGGVGVARGYVGQPALTAARFVPDPCSGVAGARLYRTGDLARYRSDGQLAYVGRRDTQVKLHGVRVELGEIEAALRQQPGVQDAVVALRTTDGGAPQLVAYLVGAADRAALRAGLRERLPEAMVPALYVALDALPLTPHGKVDRAALPAPVASSTARYAPPQTAVEEILAGIWADVLGRGRIGVEDGFFELGGHSLLATQVVVRARELLQVDLPLRWIFETPTVRGVAQQIEHAQRGGAPEPIARADRSAGLPLSWAQQRLWVLEQLQPGQSVYNVPLAMRLEGALDVKALEQSLAALVSRHESLRTRFVAMQGRPVQIVDPPWSVPVPMLDWRSIDPAARDAQLDALQRAEAEAPFDLASGRLLRAQLVCVRDCEHLLLLTLHHIVSDGWSIAVLMRELSALYTAAVQGDSLVLPALPVQYADFAVWQRTSLRGEPLDEELAYWRRQLEDAPVTELPTDFPRPAAPTFRNATVVGHLGPDLHLKLQQLCAQEGVTMFMALIAAVAVLLTRYTGQDDVVVGTSVAGRTRRETEGLIGFFLNMLVLRTRVTGNPSVRTLLTTVREIALGAYAHQDVPFDRVVEELQPARDADHSPLFRILVALQNAPMPVPDMAGLTVTPFEVASPTSKYDLTLTAVERADGLCIPLQYNTDLYTAGTARRMLDNLQVLLGSMTADPERGVLDLPMISDAELEQLTEWSHQ